MIKILVVDDLFDNIKTLKLILTESFEALEVFTATTGQAALLSAQEHQLDVILLSTKLSDMEGYEVCQQLKKDKLTQDVPVVIVTDHIESKQNRIRALKAGGDGFLTKPLDETELKAQVSAMLKLKEANDLRAQEKAKLEALVKERTKVLEQELEMRKQTEHNLKRADDVWAATFNAISDGIALVDNMQRIQNCNQAFEAIVSLSKEKLLGENCYNIIEAIKDEFGQDNCPFDLMKQTGKREMIQCYIESVAYELYVDPVYTDKQICGAVLILKDVSESVLAKAEIEKERQMLRTLIDNLPSAIYVKDKDGRKLITNAADLVNIGAESEDQVIGLTDLDLFDNVIGKRGYYDDMQVINTGTPISNREEQFINDKGEVKWVLTSKLPIIGKDGQVSGLVGIGHDISEQKQLIKELEIAKNKAEESDRLKSAFLANMSHEIRTPMNGILGFTDLLNDDNIDPVRRKMYVSNIQKSGFRMLNTVNDLIEISKIEVGEVAIHMADFDLRNTIIDICDFFAPEAEDKGIVLSYELPLMPKELWVNSDMSKIESIITNLVKNAIKYSEKGSIVFAYSIEDDFIKFSCKDTGIGIPEDRVDAVFNRFEQADIEDRLALQGSGLGLAITKAYVEMLGGDIWVKSEYGKGSIFCFTLPKSIMLHSSEDLNEADKTQTKMNSKKKILIVEDDETSMIFLQILLEPLAQELYKATNGQEAVDLCREKKPDIIFMDMKMPVMTGYDATRKIREFDPEVPIIAQSAYALGGDRERAMEAGCTDYVTKPISESKLLEFLK